MQNVFQNITVMHYFVYYNSTHSKLDETWIFYLVITYFEFVCICISYPIVVLLGVQLLRHTLFHSNLQNLVRVMILEYLTQLTSRSFQIFLIFDGQQDGLCFYYASLIRCTCYFFVSFSLPAFAVERCCASYFLTDYEKRKRHWILIIILTVTICSSVVLSKQYHIVDSTLTLHISMLLINIFFSIIIAFIEKFNYRRLGESSNLRKSKREYSLNERFQIAENIRVCEFMKTIINVVSIFNLLSTVSASMDNFDLTQTQLNVASTVFNICVLTYGSLVFFLFYYLTPPIRDDLKSVLMKLRIVNPVGPAPDEKDRSHHMAVVETDAYFDQLQKQWI